MPSETTYSEGIVARQWESLEKGVTDHGRRTDGRHVPGVKQHNREIVAAKNVTRNMVTYVCFGAITGENVMPYHDFLLQNGILLVYRQ